MKSTIKKIFPVLLCAFWLTTTTDVMAQDKSVKTTDQTVSFRVYGVCGECKERIESTAMDVKGVKKAEWDVRTDTLVLVGSSKMDAQKVALALAKAGHKSDYAAADPKGYTNLPGCCQYDSGAEKH